MAEEATYEKPSSQLDLEQRLANGNSGEGRYVSTSDQVLDLVDDGKARDFRVEEQDVSDYVGTDRIYQNYADDTHKPHHVPDTPEGVVEAEVASTLAHNQPGVEVGSQDAATKEREEQAKHGVGMPESDEGALDPHTPQDAVLNAKQFEEKKSKSDSGSRPAKKATASPSQQSSQ